MTPLEQGAQAVANTIRPTHDGTQAEILPGDYYVARACIAALLPVSDALVEAAQNAIDDAMECHTVDRIDFMALSGNEGRAALTAAVEHIANGGA